MAPAEMRGALCIMEAGMSQPSHTAASHINALTRKHYPRRKAVTPKPSSIPEAEAMGSLKGKG